jgi:alpha-tubulin suppressor-like RCC1 family protein
MPARAEITVNCRPDVAVTPARDRCDADVSLVPPTATDQGGTPFDVTGTRSDAAALDAPFPLGETDVTWSATDFNQQTYTCVQKVFVGARLELHTGVYAWGNNANGQLGNGAFGGPTNNSRATPAPVPGLPENVTAVSAGDDHSLAVTLDGALYAWGNNNWGQLGNGTFTTTGSQGIATPAVVAALPKTVATAGGGTHSLALTSDGAVFAWGGNAYGQVGNGTFTTDAPFGIAMPQPVAALDAGVIAIAAGGDHSLALTSSGAVYAWGYNYYGQLGTGAFGGETNDGIASPVPVHGLPADVVAIAASKNTSYALTRSREVYAWGNNVVGQLGNGSFSPEYPFGTAIPALVSGLPGNIVAIAARHLFAMALGADGTVYAWGDNQFGELGRGTFTTGSPTGIPTPGAVSAPPGNAVSVAAGGLHGMALTADGQAYAWGNNFYGQLGRGTYTSFDPGIATPGRVSILPATTTALAGGLSHSLALAGNTAIAGDWLPVAWALLDNSTPLKTENLTATVISCDADTADALLFTYVWKRNGVTMRTITRATEAADTLPLSTFGGIHDGDVITVTVTPFDGKADGTPDTATATVLHGPFTLADAAQALRIAGGLDSAVAADVVLLDVETAAPSADSITVEDAVRIARKAVGIDPNP